MIQLTSNLSPKIGRMTLMAPIISTTSADSPDNRRLIGSGIITGRNLNKSFVDSREPPVEDIPAKQVEDMMEVYGFSREKAQEIVDAH